MQSKDDATGFTSIGEATTANKKSLKGSGMVQRIGDRYYVYTRGVPKFFVKQVTP